jgi:hypothetical protein
MIEEPAARLPTVSRKDEAMSDPVPYDPTHPGFPKPGFNPDSLSCTSAACVTALIAQDAARSEIKIKCDEVEAAKNRRDVFAAMAAALLTLAAALFVGAGAATATVLGWPLAAILFWIAVSVAATALALAAVALVFEAQRLVIVGELGAAKNHFLSVRNDVMLVCPSTCWGDASMAC